MEDHASTTHSRPADTLRVAPSLMADGDAKRDVVDLEQLPLAVGHVERFFLRRDLVLRLIALDRALTRDHERHVVQPYGGFPLHADDDGHAVPLGRGAYLIERFLLAVLVRGRDGEVLAAQPGEVRLGK